MYIMVYLICHLSCIGCTFTEDDLSILLLEFVGRDLIYSNNFDESRTTFWMAVLPTSLSKTSVQPCIEISFVQNYPISLLVSSIYSVKFGLMPEITFF